MSTYEVALTTKEQSISRNLDVEFSLAAGPDSPMDSRTATVVKFTTHGNDPLLSKVTAANLDNNLLMFWLPALHSIKCYSSALTATSDLSQFFQESNHGFPLALLDSGRLETCRDCMQTIDRLTWVLDSDIKDKRSNYLSTILLLLELLFKLDIETYNYHGVKTLSVETHLFMPLTTILPLALPVLSFSNACRALFEIKHRIHHDLELALTNLPRDLLLVFFLHKAQCHHLEFRGVPPKKEGQERLASTLMFAFILPRSPTTRTNTPPGARLEELD